ncbi:MAG: hypothetical protein [Caudoviricetes sp.]|nr:MAG: hypothetical protein [Caudoviricetes sp.]
MATAEEDLGEEFQNTVEHYLVKNYGDQLKTSRERFCILSLPQLREYVKNNPAIIKGYEMQIRDEIIGQGLQDNAVLNSLLIAQVERFEKADTKDSTSYAREIEKMIKEGKTDRIAGEVEADNSNNTASADLVNQILYNPLEVDVTAIPKKVAEEVRNILLGSYREFSNWSFYLQMGYAFQEQDFHRVIFQAGQDIVDGKMNRVIITIPPRHSKTQTMSISLPLYSFVHNASSHNIITSYADDIVQESSGYIRTVMLDPLFQRIFPNVRIDPAKRSLERWGTTKQGVMHAVPTGGKLTGKGAGLLSDKYSGLFVVDDVIKPKDAYSDTVRTEINDRYDNTFMSRLANDGGITVDGKFVECPRTPMVIIMQRVHDNDLVGYLLRGGSSDKYHYLNIPGIIEKDTGSAEWYDKLIKRQAYTHAIPILYDLGRGEEETALWPSRKSLASLRLMREANPYTYNSQYAGDPSAMGHGLVQEGWWKEFDKASFDVSTIERSFITADTASTVKDYSDYSVLIHWAIQRGTRNAYAWRVMVGKFETPELKDAVIKFWNECNTLDMRNPCLLPTAMYMEDKSSGQFLNQQFARDGNIRLMPVPRDKTAGDKVGRFMNTLPYWAQGRIHFDTNCEHTDHCKRELLGMTSLGSGTGHDDVCDNVSDMCAIEYSGISANYDAWM